MSIGMSHFRCYYYTISVDSQVYRMFGGRYMGEEDEINKTMTIVVIGVIEQ